MLYRMLLSFSLFFALAGSSPDVQTQRVARLAAMPTATGEDGKVVAERKSEHFRFLYDPTRLSPAKVEEVVREAEASFKEIAALFPEVTYTEPIVIRLDARFRGATGYAAPGGKSGKGKFDVIGLRFEDLPTLGLSPAFLFRHELTHIFVGRWEDGKPNPGLSGSPLGEGIADLTADGRNRLGLPLSFAKHLQKEGAWIDMERLFLRPSGGRPPIARDGRTRYEDVLRWRIARYVEPSLFLSYVRSRIGWDKMREFYIDYARAARMKNPSDNLRAVFRRHLGELPEETFEKWQAAIDAAPEEPEANRRRLLSERAYAGVQWYDFLVAAERIPESEQTGIEAQFRALHADIADGKLDGSEGNLRQLLRRVEGAIVDTGAEQTTIL
jgi:hypothetical protein